MGSDFENEERQRENPSGKDIRGEERYSLLINAVSDYAILMLDPSGRVATWNTGAQKIKGYSADEIIGRCFSIFYTPEEVAAGEPENKLATATALGHLEDEGRRVRRDGSRFWANVTLTAMHACVRRCMRVRQSDARYDRAYATHGTGTRQHTGGEIQRTPEEEQKRITRKLHDDLGQQLTALRIAVVLRESSLGAIGVSHRILSVTDELLAQIGTMVTSVRRIAADLRPHMLDDRGLVAALEWLAEDFSRRYGAQVDALGPGGSGVYGLRGDGNLPDVAGSLNQHRATCAG